MKRINLRRSALIACLAIAGTAGGALFGTGAAAQTRGMAMFEVDPA